MNNGKSIGEKNKIIKISSRRLIKRFVLNVRLWMLAKPIMPAISLSCCEQVKEDCDLETAIV